ncbi:MAG: hypothetical protein LAN37_16575 [Acidobacteriia bacterium]|nr:hypothetical protein [Terriglobia bacterium]
MTPLSILAIIWGVVTGILVILMIYRSTLTMHEDDQLFLDEAGSHMQKEQTELLARMNKIQPFLRLFGAASGLLILVMAGLFVWQAFNLMQ